MNTPARADADGRPPVPVTSFIGRRAEMETVCALVRAHRLVTLTGPGGSGKTRLAVEAVATMADAHPDGLHWVDLAPLTDPALVTPALAAALGIPEPREPVIETVLQRLAERRALVILDNCEHLIEACAWLAAELVQRCSGVRVIATTRELLGVPGEVRYPVPPLTLPGDGTDDPSEAVQLFVDRAGAARPNFALSDLNRGHVAEICRRLDGIPLAIELAAARVRHLTVAEIEEGLDDRFRLLVGSARSALPRQRTLESSVDWSHSLLDERERAVFRRLAVFPGTFGLDTAEAVCADGDIASSDVLIIVSALVDRSLVHVADEPGLRTRYRLLETMRDYASRKLATADEALHARERHFSWCVGLADRAAIGLAGPEAGSWLAVIDAELSNLRAALDWSADATDSDAGARIVGGLTLYWFTRGETRVGRERLEATLNRCAERRSRAEALTALCHVAYRAGDMAAASRLGDDAIAVARRLGDPAVLGRALHFRAWVRFWGEGDRSGAWDAFEEADALLREAGDSLFLGLNLALLGWSYADTSRAGEARAVLEEALSLTQGSGAPQAYALFALGWLDTLQGATADGVARLEACVQLAEAVGDHYIELWARALLAARAIDENRDDARQLCERGLQLAVEHRLPAGEAAMRYALAGLHLVNGDVATAEVEIETALRRSPMPWFSAVLRAGVAQVALLQGRAQDARPHAEIALRAGQEHDSVLAASVAFAALASAAALDGDLHRAEDLLHNALAAVADVGFRPLTRSTLKTLSDILARQQRLEEAVRLLSAAHASSQPRATLLDVDPRDEGAALRDALGADAFDRAWADGAAMSLEDAVAYARRGRGQRRRPTHGWASLTPTEERVVALVAEGLTNPQIGQRLFSSPRTVQTHLARVFAKLHVTTRSELASLATERALGR